MNMTMNNKSEKIREVIKTYRSINRPWYTKTVKTITNLTTGETTEKLLNYNDETNYGDGFTFQPPFMAVWSAQPETIRAKEFAQKIK